jgi:hypothetical protein
VSAQSVVAACDAAGPQGGDLTVVNPWLGIGSEFVTTPAVKYGPVTGRDAQALRNTRLSEIAENKRRDAGKDLPPFSAWVWAETLKWVLQTRASKDRDQKAHNLRIYAYMERSSILTCHKRPTLLYGTRYVPSGPACTWNSGEVNLEFAKKTRVDGGFVRMRCGDMLHVAGQLVLGENRTARYLNMANANIPGGGVWNGRAEQEEYSYRRTDMALHATGWQNKKANYPLRFGSEDSH